MLTGLGECKDLNSGIFLLNALKYISQNSSTLTTNLTPFVTLFMSNSEFKKTLPLNQNLINVLIYLNNQYSHLIY